MSNIEDDVKVLENYLKELDNLFSRTNINNTKERNAIRNILSEREQDKARIKELEEENMQKDLEKIGIEENIKADMKEIIEKYYTANEECIPKQREKEMQARIKELEEELYSANKIVEEYLDGVPKLKIKNIMKELNNEYKKIDDSIDIYSNSDDRGKIDCLQMIGWLEGELQELLQESEG